jgi:uncharacterized protein with PQ loop repeat
MALADSVDLAFSNNISLDAIAVVGCVASISGLTRALSRPGQYIYRVVRSHESQCVQLNILVGSFFGLIIFLFSGFINNLFTLTDVQHDIFQKVLYSWALYVPANAVGNMALDISMLRGHIKRYNFSLCIFYTIEILGDVIVFFLTKNLPLMYFTTTLAYITCGVYILMKEKIVYEKLTLKFVRDTTEFWLSKSLERAINGVAHTTYGVLATRMSVENYAIHSVLFNLLINCEIITNGYNAALILKLELGQKFESALAEIKKWASRTIIPLLGIYIIYCSILLFTCKGEISITSFFPWIFFYCLEFFGLYVYESFEVFAVNQKTSKVFPIGTVCGAIVRIGISAIGLLTQYPLFFFGISVCLDWTARGIIYYFGTKRIRCVKI